MSAARDALEVLVELREATSPWLRLPLAADEAGAIWMNDGDRLTNDAGVMEPADAAFLAAAANFVSNHAEALLVETAIEASEDLDPDEEPESREEVT